MVNVSPIFRLNPRATIQIYESINYLLFKHSNAQHNDNLIVRIAPDTTNIFIGVTFNISDTYFVTTKWGNKWNKIGMKTRHSYTRQTIESMGYIDKKDIWTEKSITQPPPRLHTPGKVNISRLPSTHPSTRLRAVHLCRSKCVMGVRSTHKLVRPTKGSAFRLDTRVPLRLNMRNLPKD